MSCHFIIAFIGIFFWCVIGVSPYLEGTFLCGHSAFITKLIAKFTIKSE